MTIGDGTTLRADFICGGVELKVQGQTFTLDLYPLALRGTDIVLGTQWLQSLAPVTFDFSNLTLTFRRNGRKVLLDGNQPRQGPTLQPLVGFPSAGDRALLLQMAVAEPEHPSPRRIAADLQELLHEFQDLFEEPRGLPPNRRHDHRIQIVPGAEPANVRPYRYPHIQNRIFSSDTDSDTDIRRIAKLKTIS